MQLATTHEVARDVKHNTYVAYVSMYIVLR